jgi:uncharacterized protein (TIGR00730 family)
MKRIVVFCGSSPGNGEQYRKQAFRLGQVLAGRGIELVYGGARVGLMGAVADGVLKEGGKAIGILPVFLQTKEVAHDNLTELILVDTMHERKAKMNELSDGVITLPGGFGTMEEFFEMLTWGQLGLHRKPVGILNVNGFYDPLLRLVQAMVDQGFLKEINQRMLLVSADIDGLLRQMEEYTPPTIGKWLSEKET